MTKISASLPGGHGLDDINDIAIAKPATWFLLVGVVTPSKITKDLHRGNEEATVAFEAIEMLRGAEAEEALEMMRRAREQRTGEAELPINFDPETGEVIGSEEDQ